MEDLFSEHIHYRHHGNTKQSADYSPAERHHSKYEDTQCYEDFPERWVGCS